MSRPVARSALDQLSGRPALIAPQYASSSHGLETSEVTSGKLIGDIRELAAVVTGDAAHKAWGERRGELASQYGGDYDDAERKPFAFSNGKAIIPIHGILLNRFSWSWSFATGYNFIRNQIAAAMADEDVDGLIYDVNSYGGLVAGCSETSDIIWQNNAKNGGKPSIALVDANCFSAAYMLACSADRISLTPTGQAGSIGVVIMHMDVSKMMSDIGIEITFIHAGADKTLGNPYEPLSKSDKQRMQQVVDTYYGSFVATVARGRSMDPQAIRDTEAGCFLSNEALELGLIDAVQPTEDAIESFFNGDDPEVPDEVDTDEETDQDEDDLDDDDDNTRGNKMAAPGMPKTEAELKKTMETAAATQQAEADAKQATAVEAAKQEAMATERARIKGITQHAEAANRPKLAAKLAHDTSMGVEEAGAILAAAAVETAPTPEPAAQTGTQQAGQSQFDKAMGESKQPNVGAGGGGGADTVAGGGGAGGENDNLSPAARLLAAQTKATGVKPREKATDFRR